MSYFLPQNATNADKSFEALLSHTIGELSKGNSVYRVNSDEASMVSHRDDSSDLLHLPLSLPPFSFSHLLSTNCPFRWETVLQNLGWSPVEIYVTALSASCRWVIDQAFSLFPLSSWSRVCGPHSPSSSACSSSACPSFASPAFCSITFTETA